VMRGLANAFNIAMVFDLQATHLYGNPFADLSKAKDKTLRHAIINVLFQILYVLVREQVPAICALNNPRWRCRRTRIGIASVH